MSTPPIPPEIKAANRRRALELVAGVDNQPMSPEFVATMRTVILPAYREVLARENQDGAADKTTTGSVAVVAVTASESRR